MQGIHWFDIKARTIFIKQANIQLLFRFDLTPASQFDYKKKFETIKREEFLNES